MKTLLTDTVLALWLIVTVVPCAAFAAGVCPAADAAAQTALGAQRRLLALPAVHGEELGLALSPLRRDAIRTWKDALVAAIDARLACSDSQIGPAALQRTLMAALVMPAASAKAAPVSPFGRNPNVHVVRTATPRPLVLVQAGFDIECGDDNLLVGYTWIDGDKNRKNAPAGTRRANVTDKTRNAAKTSPPLSGWQRVLRWQSSAYQKISGAYGHGFAFAPLSSGHVVIVHGAPWCTSNWSLFSADVIAPAALVNGAPTQRTVFHLDVGYNFLNGNFQLATHPDGFEVRATLASNDPALWGRTGIFRYRVQGNSVRRVQPIATNGRDFVDAWLSADAAHAREWTAPATTSAALKARGALLARIHAGGDTEFAFGPVRACSGGGNRYQVEMNLNEYSGKTAQPATTKRYALIRGENDGFTMLGLSAAADPSCRSTNLMPQPAR